MAQLVLFYLHFLVCACTYIFAPTDDDLFVYTAFLPGGGLGIIGRSHGVPKKKNYYIYNIEYLRANK